MNFLFLLLFFLSALGSNLLGIDGKFSGKSNEKSAVKKSSQTLPTLYEYYTTGGIQSGLVASSDQFALNGKPYVIYGGSFHYFRVVPEYWAPVLQRFKAAGLNSVQLYLPWNLHEEIPGKFDFESPWLNLNKFLQLIKDADLFAVVRIGPYICAEWEFGGFPSWFLRDPNMRVRTMYQPYLDRVKTYWTKALSIVNQHQFSLSGGPVIAIQIENEYFGAPNITHDLRYLQYLLNITRDSGYKGLLFTSDPVEFAKFNPIQGIPELLETANLNRDAFNQLMVMRGTIPNRPIYVSEFWPGWFDLWGNKNHSSYGLDQFDKQVSDILYRVNGSINYYMFIGGTNFGFMNGARVVTSYDYDAPLTESGNYTDKYFDTRDLYDQLVSTGRMPKIALPDTPPEVSLTQEYGTVEIQDWIPLEVMLDECTRFVNAPKPVSMELLELGPGVGQRWGFVLYRAESTPVGSYEITGPIKDRGIFMIDGNTTYVLEDGSMNFSIPIDPAQFLNPKALHRFDILVENQGRINWGVLDGSQRKGIESDIRLNGSVWNNFTIYSLDLNQTYLDRLNSLDSHWIPFDQKLNFTGPAMFRTQLKISGTPGDTYILLPGWTKGNVFVNGFNLGRYWSVGPEQTLYIPAPLLKTGSNWIDLFELHGPGDAVQFIDYPILGPNWETAKRERTPRRSFGGINKRITSKVNHRRQQKILKKTLSVKDWSWSVRP